MKVEEAIYESLRRYPSVYAMKDYEASKFAILHHYFIVLGNGIEWAHTKNPKDAGYLTSPQHYKRNGEWIRKYDKPYHKSGVVIDQAYLDKACSQGLHYVFPKDFKFDKKHPYVWDDEIASVDLKEWIVSPTRETDFMMGKGEKSTYPYDHPYPNFQKQYSCFWEDGWEFIQPDWREAAIEHLEYWRKWHLNYDKLLLNANRPTSHYYTAESIEKSIKEYEGKKGFMQHEDYVKQYNWTGNYAILAQLINVTTAQKIVDFCTETLNRLGQLTEVETVKVSPKETDLFYIYDKTLKMYKCLFGWSKNISEAHAWDKPQATDFANYHRENEDNAKRFVLQAQTV